MTPVPSSLAPAAPPEASAARPPQAAGLLGKDGGQPVTARPTATEKDQARRDRRAEAYRWRIALWELSSLARVRACGRRTFHGAGGPVLRIAETPEGRRAGLAGLQSCGSPWACPVCARRIAGTRARDVRHVLGAASERGGSAALVTLTMRHHAGQRLADLWAALAAAWGSVTSGGRWKAEKARFGILGWVRTVECTHGAAGWHLHVHAVVMFDGPVSRELMEAVGASMFTRWSRALARRGLSAVAENGGLDVRPVRMTGESLDQVADYVSKAAFEVTSPSTKDGRYGNRSPFRLLGDVLEHYLADDFDLWAEWEHASHGRQQVTWSNGLRDWARLGRERTDDEIVAEDQQGEDVLAIAPESWPAVRPLVAELLDVAEGGGGDAVRGWLSRRGIRWVTPAYRRPTRRRE